MSLFILKYHPPLLKVQSFLLWRNILSFSRQIERYVRWRVEKKDRLGVWIFICDAVPGQVGMTQDTGLSHLSRPSSPSSPPRPSPWPWSPGGWMVLVNIAVNMNGKMNFSLLSVVLSGQWESAAQQYAGQRRESWDCPLTACEVSVYKAQQS